VWRLKVGEDGPWQVALITMQILCFTWATTNPSFNKRLQGAPGDADEHAHPRDMNLVLAEIGCLACFDGEGYDRASILCRRDLSRAAKIAQGKEKDPDWPIDARVLALRNS